LFTRNGSYDGVTILGFVGQNGWSSPAKIISSLIKKILNICLHERGHKGVTILGSVGRNGRSSPAKIITSLINEVLAMLIQLLPCRHFLLQYRLLRAIHLQRLL
jgi:hypothetical protein